MSGNGSDGWLRRRSFSNSEEEKKEREEEEKEYLRDLARRLFGGEEEFKAPMDNPNSPPLQLDNEEEDLKQMEPPDILSEQRPQTRRVSMGRPETDEERVERLNQEAMAFFAQQVPLRRYSTPPSSPDLLAEQHQTPISDSQQVPPNHQTPISESPQSQSSSLPGIFFVYDENLIQPDFPNRGRRVAYPGYINLSPEFYRNYEGGRGVYNMTSRGMQENIPPGEEDELESKESFVDIQRAMDDSTEYGLLQRAMRRLNAIYSGILNAPRENQSMLLERRAPLIRQLELRIQRLQNVIRYRSARQQR
jgi:hypothetical protein